MVRYQPCWRGHFTLVCSCIICAAQHWILLEDRTRRCFCKTCLQGSFLENACPMDDKHIIYQRKRLGLLGRAIHRTEILYRDKSLDTKLISSDKRTNSTADLHSFVCERRRAGLMFRHISFSEDASSITAYLRTNNKICKFVSHFDVKNSSPFVIEDFKKTVIYTHGISELARSLGAAYPFSCFSFQRIHL